MGRTGPAVTLLFAALCVDHRCPTWIPSRIATCLPRLRMTGQQESIDRDHFSSARYRQAATFLILSGFAA